ncbi:MAG: hypothetical protein Q8M95_16715 [Candidatus Methanoperedens sp.]|nr:hypothetical protein [Candidatus Methanoperedens sp.]
MIRAPRRTLRLERRASIILGMAPGQAVVSGRGAARGGEMGSRV